MGNASEKIKGQPLSDEQQQTFMNDWMNWAVKNRNAIADQGSPLGNIVRASSSGVESAKNSVTGYVIVQAGSHDAAAKLFIDHPHVKLFQGNSVEIIECLSIPQ